MGCAFTYEYDDGYHGDDDGEVIMIIIQMFLEVLHIIQIQIQIHFLPQEPSRCFWKGGALCRLDRKDYLQQQLKQFFQFPIEYDHIFGKPCSLEISL